MTKDFIKLWEINLPVQVLEFGLSIWNCWNYRFENVVCLSDSLLSNLILNSVIDWFRVDVVD